MEEVVGDIRVGRNVKAQQLGTPDQPAILEQRRA
jgi:hypothetical protein